MDSTFNYDILLKESFTYYICIHVPVEKLCGIVLALFRKLLHPHIYDCKLIIETPMAAFIRKGTIGTFPVYGTWIRLIRLVFPYLVTLNTDQIIKSFNQ